MSKGPFLASDFLPTKFWTRADKATFGNTLLHFIDSEWKQTLFTEKFYNQLSNTFGNIEHYDRATFYSTWFTCDADRLRFLEQALGWPCWGDPAFTFCDVERALQREIRERNYVLRYQLKAAQSLRSAEMLILARLEAKYRPARHCAEDPTEPMAALSNEAPTALENTVVIQGSLF